MDIAKRLLIEALKKRTGEASAFSESYQVDKLLDPTAELSATQSEMQSEHTLLDEDERQSAEDAKKIELQEEN